MNNPAAFQHFVVMFLKLPFPFSLWMYILTMIGEHVMTDTYRGEHLKRWDISQTKAKIYRI